MEVADVGLFGAAGLGFDDKSLECLTVQGSIQSVKGMGLSVQSNGTYALGLRIHGVVGISIGCTEISHTPCVF